VLGLPDDRTGDHPGGPSWPSAGEARHQPCRRLGLDPARRAGAPDHEVGDGDEVAGPSLVGAGDGLLEGDQNLGLLAGDKAVREDGALQAAQVAEADAVAFQGFGDEGTKRGAYGLTLLCRMGLTGLSAVWMERR
jgi:hypothetical protein